MLKLYKKSKPSSLDIARQLFKNSMHIFGFLVKYFVQIQLHYLHRINQCTSKQHLNIDSGLYNQVKMHKRTWSAGARQHHFWHQTTCAIQNGFICFIQEMYAQSKYLLISAFKFRINPNISLESSKKSLNTWFCNLTYRLPTLEHDAEFESENCCNSDLFPVTLQSCNVNLHQSG